MDERVPVRRCSSKRSRYVSLCFHSPLRSGVNDSKSINIQALVLSVGLQFLQQKQERLGGLDRVTSRIPRFIHSPVRNFLLVSPKGDRTFLLLHRLKQLLGRIQSHATYLPADFRGRLWGYLDLSSSTFHSSVWVEFLDRVSPNWHFLDTVSPSMCVVILKNVVYQRKRWN